jgi:pSer/pThr/pTyr-binding forkhead associated (FHA) protein
MSSSLDHKCQRCGSEYHGQLCPFCTITGLDVNALLAQEGLEMPSTPSSKEAEKSPALGAPSDAAAPGEVVLIDVVSNRTYPINSPVSRFGRDISNDVVLTGDKSLSRFHFQVTIVNSEYFVEDAGSRNGTFLNGAPVTSPKKLLNGDIISAGMSRYRLVIGGEAMPDNSAGEAAALALAEKAENEQSPSARPSVAAQAVDPLKKIMEEGQALLNSSAIDPIADAQDFLSGKNGDDSAPTPPKYMELNRGEETPIDDLFQEKIDKARNRMDTDEIAKPASRAIEDAIEAALPDPAPQPPAPAPAPAPIPAAAPPAGSHREWPQWCIEYTFPEVAEYKSKMEMLEQEIRERQQQLAELQENVSKTDDVRNRVLATTGRELVDACSEVLRLLGWETGMNGSSDNEVVVSHDGTAQAIAKIVTTDGSQPRPQELATLVSSLSTYWCDNGVEPKGVLVVSMMGDCKPADRAEFSKDIAEYAAKKNVCLMSTVQLLTMYRDIVLAEGKPDDIRSEILAASGGLKGFEAAKA